MNRIVILLYFLEVQQLFYSFENVLVKLNAWYSVTLRIHIGREIVLVMLS